MKLHIDELPPRFALDKAVCSYGFCQLAPSRWRREEGALHHVFRGEQDRLIPVVVTQREGAVVVASSVNASAAERRVLRAQLGRMLRLDEDLAPWHKLHPPARRGNFGRLFRSATLFEDIVKTMTCCNVAWPNTVKMNALMVEHFGGGGFPTPAQLAAVEPGTLKAVCKVGYRAERIVRLARGVNEGSIDLAAIENPALTTEELFDRLRAIHGVGPYAASNLLMLLGRYDRLAIDSETYRHFRQVHGVATPKTSAGLRRLHQRIEKHYARYAPYPFLAYWFELWHRYAGTSEGKAEK